MACTSASAWIVNSGFRYSSRTTEPGSAQSSMPSQTEATTWDQPGTHDTVRCHLRRQSCPVPAISNDRRRSLDTGRLAGACVAKPNFWLYAALGPQIVGVTNKP
jgi:hypothetical protein